MTHQPCRHCGAYHSLLVAWSPRGPRIICPTCMASGPVRRNEAQAWAAWDQRDECAVCVPQMETKGNHVAPKGESS